MNKYRFLASVESLESRISPGLLLSTAITAHVVSIDIGDDPPITQPSLSPTGPVGPGSSS